MLLNYVKFNKVSTSYYVKYVKQTGMGSLGFSKINKAVPRNDNIS